ncbi:amino acid ABC transporter permease [Streptomyces sp. LHD-70]|uniref:amino acid ABC transporter permease n=1 Tax=Streptomyces sp. LHD-70 TaxID=3072140 RepID=UPI00280D36CD|nr:amino acid ABC transporter permease [Streptomyces sp. LHD-70]MDQ8705539.1 amino acid ABC transporter permease [Streptomyces sp. LHD-70]
MINSTLTEPHTHPDELRTVARRHPWRWVSALLALAVGTAVVWSFAGSPNLQWGEVGSCLTAGSVIDGIGLTVLLTVVAQGVGIVGGIVLAVMRRSSNPVLKAISGLYLWIFRGTPVLIQIIFWYNLALIFPAVALHIPFTSIGFSVATNSLITPVAAAVIALGLNEAAYMAEIVRGGLISVEQGQSEAAATLGMTRGQAMRHVILPQALRTIVPPTGNELINMLKNTSLVSVIAARELLTATQQIYGVNYLVIELLIVASIWYLALSTVASLAQSLLERRLQVVLRVRQQPWTARAAHRLASLRSSATLTSDGKS